MVDDYTEGLKNYRTVKTGGWALMQDNIYR